MVEVCPICKGIGKAKVIERYNGVSAHFGDGKDEYKTCWMCGGKGEVAYISSSKNVFIKKYWMENIE